MEPSHCKQGRREDMGGPVMVTVGLILGVLALWLTVTSDVSALVVVPPIAAVVVGGIASAYR